MKNQKGFTFVEFLIVAAIFIILAAIAIPSIKIGMDEEFFKREFGFARSAVNDTTRPALQPIVTKRLANLKDLELIQLEQCAEWIKKDDYLKECRAGYTLWELNRAKALADKLGFVTNLPRVE